MTKIITCCELRYLTLAEVEALFRTLQIELGRTAPGSRERGIVLASLDSVRNRASSSASVRYRSSQQVMIRVIRFLLFVARPRRSGPFLRPGV